ncbi:hypothetical protein [Kitasatospora camelliae]|uniref:Uncharacterized protein n=1 Tax=Kitasatospora camelliae TaxID=3156397 RepID=A0AAU8JW26_9ACTN
MNAETSLTPAEALALAGRAKAAARRPVPMPGWYGPAFGGALTAYGVVLGQSLEHELRWLTILAALLFSAGTGAMASVAVRAGGVARRASREYAGVTTAGVAAVLAIGGAIGLVVWLLGGPIGAVMGLGGAAAGLAFWQMTVVINKRIRRDGAARGEHNPEEREL